jgi:anti-sigma28 factor (negative regulator of flagellin synthesis)
VFAYHEHLESSLSRLTDDEWLSMLLAGPAVDVPWRAPVLGEPRFFRGCWTTARRATLTLLYPTSIRSHWLMPHEASARRRDFMQAFRKRSALAPQPPATSGARGTETESPERSASATSGAYLRAVRPTDAELAALERGESPIDGAKIEGLRFELEVGTWRRDSERIAQGIIADAECAREPEGR